MSEYLNYEFKDTPAFVSAYDELPLWSAPFGMLLLNNVELKTGIKVLDLGSGTGFPLLELGERLGSSSEIYGLDPWGNALKRIKQKIKTNQIKNVRIRKGLAEKIPFRNDYFDLIISNLGINNFENPNKAFSESFRVLKRGGKICITTNINGHWKEFYKIFKSTLTELNKKEELKKLEEHVQHRGSVKSVLELFNKNGFKNIRTVKDQFTMRFLNGSAFLNHHFIKLGFMDAWKNIISKNDHQKVFTKLENNLNNYASAKKELALSVPVIYMEGMKK